jgi:mRNA interferase RelE/StbE
LTLLSIAAERGQSHFANYGFARYRNMRYKRHERRSAIRKTPLADLRKYRSRAKRLVTMERYAATGAGLAKELTGRPGKRLRDGDFRIPFEKTKTEIIVTRVGPPSGVYD